MADAGFQVDDRVKRLVGTLNSLPGVETYSSCGGHHGPGLGQVPADEFTVSLDVERSDAGWRSLDLIAFAAGGVDRAQVVAWFNGDFTAYEPGGLSFSLDGLDGCQPDDLAGLIDELRLSPGV